MKHKEIDNKTYFTCNRNLKFAEKEIETRERNFRSNGSRSAGMNVCPAFIIKKIEKDSSIKAKYVVTNLGHRESPTKVNLSLNKRIELATDLSMGIDKNKIIQTNRSSNDHKSILIQKKDLNNIKKSFNLNDEYMFDANDVKSVDKFAREPPELAI